MVWKSAASGDSHAQPFTLWRMAMSPELHSMSTPLQPSRPLSPLEAVKRRSIGAPTQI